MGQRKQGGCMARDLSNRVLNHGTITGYTTFKCRCVPCAAAGAAWREKRRKHKLPMRYLPIEPLMRFVDDENRRAFSHVVKRCKVKGLNVYAADKWCVQFGVHPWVVYGDAFFADIWEGENNVES